MTHHTRAVILITFISIIAAALFAVAPSAAPAAAQGTNIVIANTGAVNIRSGPSANTTVLGTVVGGTELSVTGRNANLTWWRVNSPFGVGWVSDVTVIFRGVLDSVPIVSEPTGELDPPKVVVDRFPATVYRNPNSDSFIIGIAPTGAILFVTGRSTDGNWWRVETIAGTGFVRVADVALRGDIALVPRVTDPGPSFRGPTVLANGDLPVTTQPGGGDTIGTLAAGTALPTSGRTADNTWWQVAGMFGIGWIPVSNISLAGAASNIPVTSSATFPGPAYTGAAFATITIDVERKVAYHEASYASPPMWDARLGEQGGVVARSADGLWLQVTIRGYIGWINFSGITLHGNMAAIPILEVMPQPIANIAIVNTHMLHVRSGPGVQYQSLATVRGGSTLSVTGRHPSLPWLRVEGDYGVGWVRIMYIIFRGDWLAVPFVREPVGGLEVPITVMSIPRTVYSQHDRAYPAGTLPPDSYPIIGRTADYQWALLQTPLGDVWVPYSDLTLRGIESLIPVVP